MNTDEVIEFLKRVRDLGATEATAHFEYGTVTAKFPENVRYRPLPAGYREVEPATPAKPLTEEEQRIVDDEELIP